MSLAVSPRLALLELADRAGVGKVRDSGAPPRIADYLATRFDKQQEVIQCKARRVAVETARRSGKSSLIPALLFDAGHKYPGTVVYYIHPDGGSRAMDTVMGPDINLEAINDTFGLGWHVNLVSRSLTHRLTRTVIRIRGADDAREVKKFRGDKVSRAVGDEAQNFPSSILKSLLDDDLGPALADLRGQFFLAGTPGQVLSDDDYWCSITRNDSPEGIAKRRPGWVVFHWTALDNPAVRENHAAELADTLAAILAALPGEQRPAEHSASFILRLLLSGEAGQQQVQSLCALFAPHLLREKFGIWVRDGKGLLYAFDDTRNTYDGTLPRGHTWRFSLGGDLGTGDAYAHVVWAWAPTHPVVYEVESYKEAGLHADQWRLLYRQAQRDRRPTHSVVDEGGLGHGVAESWRKTHAMVVEPAEKQGKMAHIALMNSALLESRIKVRAGSAIASEWASLRRRPNSSATALEVLGDDHAADAALYSWRAISHLVGKADTPTPEAGTPEAAEAARKARLRNAAEEVERHRRARMDALGGLGGMR